MKRNQIMLGAVFSVFLVVSTPVLANVLHKENYASSSDIIKKGKVDQKELLFQTIVDIANNKDIQRIIIKSQISREDFFNPSVKFSVFGTPVLTKNQLKQMYLVGLMLSKTIIKSRMYSMLEQYPVSNQAMQKEITVVIEKDVTIKGEITQLSNPKCDCGDISGVTIWRFPVICTILLILGFISFYLVWYLHIGNNFAIIIEILTSIFNC